MQKAVEQRERDIAKWAAKTEGGDDDDDSLETTTKPRKVGKGRANTRCVACILFRAVPCTQRFFDKKNGRHGGSGEKFV